MHWGCRQDASWEKGVRTQVEHHVNNQGAHFVVGREHLWVQGWGGWSLGRWG